MNNKIIIVGVLLAIFIVGCLAYADSLDSSQNKNTTNNNTTNITNATDITNNTTDRAVEINGDNENYESYSQPQVDDGAYYSNQYGKTFYTGDIIYDDNSHAYYRHDRNNMWSEVK